MNFLTAYNKGRIDRLFRNWARSKQLFLNLNQSLLGSHQWTKALRIEWHFRAFETCKRALCRYLHFYYNNNNKKIIKSFVKKEYN